MMDAVLPATEVIKTFEGTPAQILRAARSGEGRAKDTENFISKFGRAKSYGEAHPRDRGPRATSMSLFYEGRARALESAEPSNELFCAAKKAPQKYTSTTCRKQQNYRRNRP